MSSQEDSIPKIVTGENEQSKEAFFFKDKNKKRKIKRYLFLLLLLFVLFGILANISFFQTYAFNFILNHFVLGDKMKLDAERVDINFFTDEWSFSNVKLTDEKGVPIANFQQTNIKCSKLIGALGLEYVNIYSPTFYYSSSLLDGFNSGGTTSGGSGSFWVKKISVENARIVSRNGPFLKTNSKKPLDELKHIYIAISDLQGKNGITKFKVANIKAQGKDNFYLTKVKGNVEINPKEIRFNNFDVNLPHSKLELNGVHKRDESSIRLILKPSSIWANDINAFVDTEDLPASIHLHKGEFSVSHNSISVNKLAVGINNSLNFQSDTQIDFGDEKKKFGVNSKISFQGLRLLELIDDVVPKKYTAKLNLSPDARKMLKQINAFSFSGDLVIAADKITLQGTTDYNSEPFFISLDYRDEISGEYTMEGKIGLENSRISRILPFNWIGNLTGELNFKYNSAKELTMNGKFRRRFKKDFSYVLFDGNSNKDGIFYYNFRVNDKMLRARLTGESHFLQSPTLNLGRIDVKRLLLPATGGNSSTVKLSTVCDFNFLGDSFDDIKGNVRLGDIQLSNGTKQVNLQGMNLNFYQKGQSMSFTCESDILKMRGHSDFAVEDSLINRLSSLRNRSLNYWISGELRDVLPKSNYEIELETKDLNPILNIFSIPLTFEHFPSLRMGRNKDSGLTDLLLNLGSFQYKEYKANAMQMEMSLDDNSFYLTTSLDSLQMQRNKRQFKLKNVHASNIVQNGNLFFNFKMADPQVKDFIDITGATKLDSLSPQRVFLYPSTLIVRGQSWSSQNVTELDLSKDKFKVDDLEFSNKEQSLRVFGEVSDSDQGKLHIKAQNIKSSSFDFLFPEAKYVDMHIDMDVVASSILSDIIVSGEAHLKGNILDNIKDADISVLAEYDTSHSQANFIVTSNNKILEANLGYNFAQNYPFGLVQVNHLNLSLFKDYFSAFAKQVSGEGNINLILDPKKHGQMRGTFAVSDFAIAVDYNGAKYHIPKALLKIKDDRLTLPDISMFDTEGNIGYLNGFINLKGDYDYDVNISSPFIQVLNTSSANNSIYFGRVFASGELEFLQKNKTTFININLSTEQGSSITLSGDTKDVSVDNKMIYFLSENTGEKGIRQKIKENYKDVFPMDVKLKLSVKNTTKVNYLMSSLNMTGYGSSDLDLRYTSKNGLRLDGEYSFDRGKIELQLGLLNKVLNVAPNSKIIFNEKFESTKLDISSHFVTRADVTGLLQAVGQSDISSLNIQDPKLKTDIEVKINGVLFNPIFTFSILFPNNKEIENLTEYYLSGQSNASQQALNVLLFNAFSSEGQTANTGEQSSLSNNLSGFLYNQLSNKLSQVIGDLVSDNIDFNINSIDLTKQRNLFDLSSSARFLNNRLILSLGLSQLNLSESERSLSNLSNDTGSVYSTNSKIEYLVTKDGRIKVYFGGKTNVQSTLLLDDKYQDQGQLGLLFNKDFEKFSDIFRGKSNGKK